MLFGSDITAPPPPPSGATALDNADAWKERQLAILSELAEAGLEIAQALKARIVETAALAPDADSARACADLTRAFDRASRAVRMAIALRERLVKDAAPGAQAARTAAEAARSERAGRVRRIVGRVAKGHFKDAAVCELLDRHVRERLFDADISGDLADLPIGALVAQICSDLGLAPRWLELAEEAWAQAEIAERPADSPYAAWPDLPPEPTDPDDLDEDLDDDGEWDDPGGSDP